MKYRLFDCFGGFIMSWTRAEIYRELQKKMQGRNIKRTNEKTLNDYWFYLTKY